jgi:hypothetical protein
MPYALILEDDPIRIAAMRSVLSHLLPNLELATFDALPPFRDFLHDHAHETRLISLDCDLTRPCPTVPDDQRGDGRDAAALLAQMPPFCPVIVHSSNYALVPVMLESLRNAGWHTTLVTPHSNPEYAWIDQDWKSVLRRLIQSGWFEPA